MVRSIPREKMSTRAKREEDRKKRATWDRSPVSRRVENRKKYDRETRCPQPHG